jgi:nitroimidazol reductase NimA-like FMN-containing flavoprotein (pyridoxamine 5'-phosphate oxidase superfamily)
VSTAPTGRTTVKRHPERGVYDRVAIDSILDEALFCHVAAIVDSSPRIIPTIHARVGETLYIHGSMASRTLRALRAGSEVCVAVTLLDGLVLARSAFNHSMNYRSVVVYGPTREVVDPTEKWDAQRALVEHIVPGRSDQARMPDDEELKQTAIFALSLAEASAKVRTGPPKDREDDYDLDVWAGELPLRLEPQAPIPDPRLGSGREPPPNVAAYRR